MGCDISRLCGFLKKFFSFLNGFPLFSRIMNESQKTD